MFQIHLNHRPFYDLNSGHTHYSGRYHVSIDSIPHKFFLETQIGNLERNKKMKKKNKME